MEIEPIVISACITMLSLGLLIVSLASYRKHKNQKLLFISFVFIVLLIKGILFSLSFLYTGLSSLDYILYGNYTGLFDLIILLLLFIATLKR